MKYYSCFIYVVCVIISFCFKTRVVFPYILYLFTFGVFMMSRIFLDAFEVENAFFDVATWANDWSFFSLPIKYEMLNAIVFYLLFSFLGFGTYNGNLHRLSEGWCRCYSYRYYQRRFR